MRLNLLKRAKLGLAGLLIAGTSILGCNKSDNRDEDLNDASALTMRLAEKSQEPSVIKFHPRGDDEYDLNFENSLGQVYVFPFATNENGNFKFGDDDDDFIFTEGAPVGDNDYFVLTNDRPKDNRVSHVVRYVSADLNNRILTFHDLPIGARQFTYEELPRIRLAQVPQFELLGKADLVFGGNTYKAFLVNEGTGNPDPSLLVDMNGDGEIEKGRDIEIITLYGTTVDFSKQSNRINAEIRLDDVNRPSVKLEIVPKPLNELDILQPSFRGFSELEQTGVDANFVYFASSTNHDLTAEYQSENLFAQR